MRPFKTANSSRGDTFTTRNRETRRGYGGRSEDGRETEAAAVSSSARLGGIGRPRKGGQHRHRSRGRRQQRGRNGINDAQQATHTINY